MFFLATIYNVKKETKMHRVQFLVFVFFLSLFVVPLLPSFLPSFIPSFFRLSFDNLLLLLRLLPACLS